MGYRSIHLLYIIIIYLKGNGRFRPCDVIGFVGEVESRSGEFGDPKSNCGICGGGWFVEFNCGRGPPSNFKAGPGTVLEPVCWSGGVPTRVGAAGGTAGENSLTAILNQYSTRQEGK